MRIAVVAGETRLTYAGVDRAWSAALDEACK